MKALFILLFSISANAYEINLYDSPSYKDKVIIEIIDNCGYSNKLMLKKTELNGTKHLEWLNFLQKNNKIDRCIDN